MHKALVAIVVTLSCLFFLPLTPAAAVQTGEVEGPSTSTPSTEASTTEATSSKESDTPTRASREPKREAVNATRKTVVPTSSTYVARPYCHDGFDLVEESDPVALPARCEKREVVDAVTDCSDYGTASQVTASGQRCVTSGVHTTRPRVSCPAGGWTLTGGQCQRTIPVKEIRTTVDQVRYEVKYTIRVAPFTAQVRVAPYTETVRVAPFAAQVRVAPYTETVRVAPFTETVTQTYTRRQRYCAQYDVEFGSGCLRWAYRNVTETVTETVDAYNYEKRDVYNYQTVDAYNYERRDVYNYQTVDAYNYETRTRWECCKSVIRERTVTVNRIEKLDSGPIRTCPAKYALDTNTNHCKRSAGTDLGRGSPVCSGAIWALNSDDWKCSRILPGVVRYVCNDGDSEISPATSPRTCRTYTCPADYVLDSPTSSPMCYQHVCSADYELDAITPTPTCFRYVCSAGYELDSSGSTPTCTYIECPDGQHRFDSEPVSSCHDDHEVPSPCSGTYARHTADNTHQDVPCPTNIACTVSDGYLARQMHRHTDTRGHANCDVHPRPTCTGSRDELWVPPSGGHRILQLECVRRTTKSGIVNPNTTLWSPFDVDSQGRPILCPESNRGVTVPNSDVGDKLKFCMEHYELAVVGYASGYDLEAAIREYEKEQGVALLTVVRDHLKWLENTFAQSGPVLVSTSPLSAKTASLFDNSEEEKLICEALTNVGFEVSGSVVKQVLKRVPYIGIIVIIVENEGASSAKSINCVDGDVSNSATDDDDRPTVTISGGSAVTEGGDATFTVSMAPPPSTPQTVDIAVTSSGDFGVTVGSRTVIVSTTGTGSLTVSTTDDGTHESDGSVTATVNEGDGYAVANPSGSVSVMISDDDDPPPATPVVSIAPGNDVTEGSPAIFAVSVLPQPSSPLRVDVSVATQGSFGVTTGTRSVTIPTTGSATLSVLTSGDSTDEPHGSVTVAVVSGTGYTVSSTNGLASVTVSDDDDPPPPPSVTISIENASGEEGLWVTFKVTLSEAVNHQVRVQWESDDAYHLDDYAMTYEFWDMKRWLTFAPGETEQEDEVYLNDDTYAEDDEIFLVRLSSPEGATIADGVGTMTITDND